MKMDNRQDDIRLVIWDLDETFWKGTLSEGKVSISEEHKNIVKKLTDRGIINSICSKNDEQIVRDLLERENMWEYFVFPHISWGAKGDAVKDIVEKVRLRAETVLFIDDNATNRAEVEFSVPGIITASPDIVTNILENSSFSGKKDKNHSRLKQYKLLESKNRDEKQFQSNEEFLKASKIIVKLCRTDLLENIERIYELIQRTNQLNYTKIRLSKDKLYDLIQDKKIDTGYVEVFDKYGDYGIVGFFACKNGELIHFLFSCRVIGLGVEQWVYASLNFPHIEECQPVVIKLKRDFCPNWINVFDGIKIDIAGEICKQSLNILLLGGCDLDQTAFYLEQSGIKFETQFNYLAEGETDVHPDCSLLIKQSREFSNEQKRKLIEECVFYDDNTFENKIYNCIYDVIIYSPLIDMSIGLWKNKIDGTLVVYGNRDYPDLTNHGYMDNSELEKFKKEYEYLGGITSNMLWDNLSYIRMNISDRTKLIILNGGECDIKHPQEKDRFMVHIEMNKVIKQFCEENCDNTFLLDVASIVKEGKDYTDNIRHYVRSAYHAIAKEIIRYLNSFGYIDYGELCPMEVKKQLNFREQTKKILRQTGLLDVAYRFRGN